MDGPIRVLHFADVHIGVENYGSMDPETGLSSRVRDFVRRMDEMIEYAREHEADLVLFAGDAFKSRAPSPTYQREFAWRIRDLAETCPVVLLPGNHDLPATAPKASTLEIYETLAVPNVTLAREYKIYRVETRRGPVQIAAVPYPTRSHLLAKSEMTGLTIDEIRSELRKRLITLIRAMADEVKNDDAPRVLLAHIWVTGATPGSEVNFIPGYDADLPLSVLDDPTWDYVALGHLHRHQSLGSGRPPVVYSGSLERVTFNEEGQEKGFCWVELQRGTASWKFIPVKARPFLTIRVDATEAAEPTEQVLTELKRHDVGGAVVRVIVSLSPENEAHLDIRRVQSGLLGAYHIAGIIKDVRYIERPIYTGEEPPESLTPIKLLERYLIGKEVPEERRVELLKLAAEIFERGVPA